MRNILVIQNQREELISLIYKFLVGDLGIVSSFRRVSKGEEKGLAYLNTGISW